MAVGFQVKGVREPFRLFLLSLRGMKGFSQKNRTDN